MSICVMRYVYHGIIYALIELTHLFKVTYAQNITLNTSTQLNCLAKKCTLGFLRLYMQKLTNDYFNIYKVHD